jgi:5'-nucleotidase
MGGTYAAIGRGIPGIAYSAANGEQRSYAWINTTTASGHPDPATLQAQLAFSLANKLIKATKSGQPILPSGYGVNVNTPYITSLTNDSCIDPPFIQTRLTGGAFTDVALYNETTGLFRYGNLLTDALNRCINGNCALPGETTVVNSGCNTAVSVFTIDYDAPVGKDQASVRAKLNGLTGGWKHSGRMIRAEVDGKFLQSRLERR